MALFQENHSVADYIDLRTRARQSEWNTAARRDAFNHSLVEYVKDELISYDLPSSLEGVI